jgi:serralysin
MKRLSSALFVVGLSALLLVGCTRPEESSALAAINADRATIAAQPLRHDLALEIKAQNWAQHLLDRSGGTCSLGTLSHSDLRVGAPAGWRMLGENVGCRIAPGDLQSFVAPLQQSFMNSPGHRANIMNGNYNAGATGLAAGPAAIGNGWLVVYEAQEFAAL